MHQSCNGAERLGSEVRAELVDDILPFWLGLRDRECGGFIGQVRGDGTPCPDADKGAIYMSRILWTFSSAYRLLGDRRYLDAATEARDFILDHMVDRQHGGVFWKVDRRGHVVDGRKQIYAQGFAIYGLSEYFRATSDAGTLDEAVKLFRCIEKYAWDPVGSGYLEAFTQSWEPIQDMRLSDKDDNEPKTMNTHLHVLEPYANLLRVWENPLLRTRLGELTEIFFSKIIDPVTGHCSLFFDMDWNCRSHVVSYGHDIEAFWLLHDALDLLGGGTLTDRYGKALKSLASSSAEGIAPDYSMIYEKNLLTGRRDEDRHWWVQAENILGNYLLYTWYDDAEGLQKALGAWRYVRSHIIDAVHGEWYWSCRADGSVNTVDDKAGFWKCPYHNGRMAMMILQAPCGGRCRTAVPPCSE